jgi:hypothetical protein
MIYTTRLAEKEVLQGKSKLIYPSLFDATIPIQMNKIIIIDGWQFLSTNIYLLVDNSFKLKAHGLFFGPFLT